MEGKLLYAFRGWIAFVAFMDLGVAIRSYIEKRSFLSQTSHITEDDDDFMDVPEDYITSRLVGIYSILKALALIHCTLYIHYKPVVSMGICSLMLTIVLYFSEVMYFRSAKLNFNIVFPSVLNVVTLYGLIAIPKHLKIWDPSPDAEDENSQLLKQVSAMKRRRNTRKNN